MKLNKEVIENVSKYRSEGLGFEDTASLCDVGISTFYKWQKDAIEIIDKIDDGILSRKKLTKGQKLLLDFLEANKKGEAKFKNAHIQNIVRASVKGSWQASAWLLERRYPDEFGRVDRNKIDLGDDVVPIQVVNDVPTDK